MAVRKVKENIFAVGAIDWDRTLFDALVPLPHGTSYNSYLVRGSEKIALIDTVEPAKFDELRQNLHELGVERIDYVVSNHAEQDHSGSIPAILEMFPDARVVANSKCRDFLIELLHLPEGKIDVVSDRDSLSLGDKNLQFLFAPWVHWPETMFTYCREDKVLFTCDFLGSHLATSELFGPGQSLVLAEAKRYYAEIMMPFARSIRKHLQFLDELEIEIAAPSHGPAHNAPQEILDAYKKWVSDEVENKVVILHVSMHGSTRKMVGNLANALMKRNISVELFNLVTADVGEIAMSLVDAATIIFASPAVLMGPHPNIVSIAFLINSLKPKAKFVSIIGSYGWGNKVVDQITALLSSLKVEFLPPLLVKGLPSSEDFQAIENLTDSILQKHQMLMQ